MHLSVADYEIITCVASPTPLSPYLAELAKQAVSLQPSHSSSSASVSLKLQLGFSLAYCLWY